MLVMRYLCLLMTLSLSTAADAAGRKAGSSFERKLESSGWTLTSKSTTVKPGDIYNRASKEIWARRKECFSADVNQRKVAGSKYLKQTKAGASGFWSGIKATAQGKWFVAKSYLDPFVYWIPTDELRFRSSCLERLRRSPDRGDLVVVTNIMSAKYKKVKRRSEKALLKVLGAGIEASRRSNSETFSKEHVTIAYKRRSVIAFMEVDPRTQGTLKLKTTTNTGKKCAGRVWVDREHVGYTERGVALPVPIKANTKHLVQGGCKKAKSDRFSLSVRPGQNLDFELKMQKYSQNQLLAAEARYRKSKGLDTAGYVVASGLLATSAYFYIKSNSHYSEAEEINDVSQGSKYAELRSQGKSASDLGLITGGSGALVLTSALTHALLSTAIKKHKYKQRKKSRGK